MGHTFWRRGPGQDTGCAARVRRPHECCRSMGAVVSVLPEALEELLEERLEGRLSRGPAQVGAYGVQRPNWRY
jgi:hypothetical protein